VRGGRRGGEKTAGRGGGGSFDTDRIPPPPAAGFQTCQLPVLCHLHASQPPPAIDRLDDTEFKNSHGAAFIRIKADTEGRKGEQRGLTLWLGAGHWRVRWPDGLHQRN
jgi:hypothetical protein